MKRILAMLALVASFNAQAQKFDGLAVTPQMGWNSWNSFACDINEQLIRDTADAMVRQGLKDAGYEYVNIDDCWHGKRDENGVIHPDAQRFPSGMKALADYVHSKGLKLGIYSDVGATTCGGHPGSRGHEYQDAITYAAWGVDYVKYDWCDSKGLSPIGAYTTMRDAIRSAGRPMLFSMCEWGDNKPWEWAADVGHSWRTTGDIYPCWDCELSHSSFSRLGVMRILDKQAGLRKYAGPGHWNDMDMLEVGMGMTADEDRAHFAIWAMMASPLILGNDLRSMPESTRRILSNKDVIAINQDKAGIQAWKFMDASPLEYWAKPLANDEWAIMVLNRGEQAANISYDWKAHLLSDDLTKREADFKRKVYNWRDIWGGKSGDTSKKLETKVAPHSVLLLRLKPASVPVASMTAADPRVARMGRTEVAADGGVRFSYPGVSFFLNFEGTRLGAMAQASGEQTYLDVVVDGKGRRIRLNSGRQTLALAEGLTAGPHTVEIVNRSETWQGNAALLSFDTDGAWRAAPGLPARKLLLLGDSITCGAAVDRVAGETKAGASWANPRASYGMLMAKQLNAQVQLVCYGGRGLIRTWDGKTNDLNLADYYNMALPTQPVAVPWNQRDYRPDAIVVAIGTNDMTIGIPEREQYVQAYVTLVRMLLRDHPQAQIMLTEGGMLHDEKQAALRSYIAETVRLVGNPRVHAIASTSYPGDAIDAHPTKEQSISIANDLLPQVRAVMRW